MSRRRKETIIIKEDRYGGYYAISNNYAGAIGQGKTPFQALKDLEESIKVLEEYKAKKKKGKKLSRKKENKLVSSIVGYLAITRYRMQYNPIKRGFEIVKAKRGDF